MAVSPAIVVYVSAAGFDVPAVVTDAYDTNGAVVTDVSDTVTADLVLLNYASTKLTGVTKGTTAGTFAFLSAYSA